MSGLSTDELAARRKEADSVIATLESSLYAQAAELDGVRAQLEVVQAQAVHATAEAAAWRQRSEAATVQRERDQATLQAAVIETAHLQGQIAALHLVVDRVQPVRGPGAQAGGADEYTNTLALLIQRKAEYSTLFPRPHENNPVLQDAAHAWYSAALAMAYAASQCGQHQLAALFRCDSVQAQQAAETHRPTARSGVIAPGWEDVSP